MDQLRVLLAIALSFLVFFVWNFFFVEPKSKDASFDSGQTAPSSTQPSDAGGTPGASPLTPIQTSVAEKDLPVEKPAHEARKIVVDTPLYRVVINERGAVFDSFVLKQYREAVAPNAPLKELIHAATEKGTLRLVVADEQLPDLAGAVFSTADSRDRIAVVDQPMQLVFGWESKDGIRVEKRFTFHPDRYLIDLEATLANESDAARELDVGIQISDVFPPGKGGYAFEGASALIDDKLEQVKPKKVDDNNEFRGDVTWVGLEDRYFIKSVIPLNGSENTVKLDTGANDVVNSRLLASKTVFAPATQRRYAYNIFFGPKSMKVLKGQGHELSRAIKFGMFDFIAKPFLWFMNVIYGFIPNYGVAIILLTVVTKILLWPLGNKSYKSMNEMKRIQPLMAGIREKYKNDKKMMNQEMMALYRTYKINPMGGCLPMVLQIPVFFALYRMLYQAIELRHAPFFLWINDLSAPDRLFRFDFSIPLMQPPYGVPVLTLVMGATMLLQQKMSPPPGDPAQAKMMMLMPIVFTFIFINFSSGLVLYWLVNNVLSIAQQYYIQKKYA